MTDSVRIGVVGAGAWSALAHVPAVLANPHAELVGLADPDERRLGATASHHGVTRTFASHRELLAEARPQGLVIASPHVTHYAIARDALDAGVHVLVEKPMTVRSEEAWDLAERAAAGDLHLVVGYTANFGRTAARAREVVGEGRIGTVTMLSVLFTSSMLDCYSGRPAPDSPYSQASPIGGPDPSTYGDPTASGGGQGQSQTTHPLGMALWVCGLRPKRVAAFMSSRGTRVDVVNALAVEFAGGALGTVASTGDAGPAQTLQEQLHYYGTEGTLVQDFLTGELVLHGRNGETSQLMQAAAEEDAAPMYAPLDTLVSLVRGDDVPNCGPGGVGADVVSLLEAAYVSAEQGGRSIDVRIS